MKDQQWAEENLNYIASQQQGSSSPPPAHQSYYSPEPNTSLVDGTLGYNGGHIEQISNEAGLY